MTLFVTFSCSTRRSHSIKTHLANLYEYDKASFDECVQFVYDHLEQIYDSTERPMEGKRWWTKADDP